ncbi:MAG TPA: ABC transporter substrate binding protein [Rhodocyclaceae bacterium]
MFARLVAAALSLLLPLLSWAAPGAVAPTDPARAAAVVYDEYGDPAAFDFSSIIAGIEKTPDVVLYPMASPPRNIELASSTPTLRPSRSTAAGDDGNIVVLYPDVGEPYRSVFAKIIEGIEDRARGRTLAYAVGANQSSAELVDELRRQGVRVVIALGRNGLKAAAGLDRDIGVVAGAVVSAPEADMRGMIVHSLAPDPMLLFDRLRAMMPGARRVFVVYDPRQNAWLLRLAREAARANGLELVAQEAPDLKTAMRLYQEVVAGADPRRDALWLPQDSVTVEESAVLPVVLQEAWNRGLAVFSSSVAHVKRGALFSLYPNNVELGRSLAGTAISQLTGNSGPARGVLPLKDVLMAVNVRTASHLGLGVAHRQLSFDMVFPEQ